MTKIFHNICFFLFVFAALFADCTASRATQIPLERIRVAPDSRGFIMANSKQPFHPWGFNYGNNGRFMEDFWDNDWQTFADDFSKMKALGANVVRVSLQYGKFMSGPDQPNPEEFKQLSRTLRLAEQTGLYLDVTGLACYRPCDTPKWYNAMDEPHRWAAQSNFWSAVAATCAQSPAVFCYDLVNEPISPGSKREPGAWPSGSLFGGSDFLQYIALDPDGRKREDIAVKWIRVMTTAIRSHDANALITVGLLPWDPHGGFYSGFAPKKIAPELDFIAVHIYPETKDPGTAMEGLRKCAVDKPVVIEETFPLRCDSAQLENFLRDSKRIACGWMGHYDGCSLQDFDSLERAGKLTLPQAIYREWARLFVKLKPEFAPETVPAVEQ